MKITSENRDIEIGDKIKDYMETGRERLREERQVRNKERDTRKEKKRRKKMKG